MLISSGAVRADRVEIFCLLSTQYYIYYMYFLRGNARLTVGSPDDYRNTQKQIRLFTVNHNTYLCKNDIDTECCQLKAIHHLFVGVKNIMKPKRLLTQNNFSHIEI